MLSVRLRSFDGQIAEDTTSVVSSLDESGKHKVNLRSDSDAKDVAARVEVVRERGTEQDTLQLGPFMMNRKPGLSKERLERISRTKAYVSRYDKEKVWFHIDDVKTHIFKGLRPDEDIIQVAECTFDEHGYERCACQQSKFGVKLAAAEMRRSVGRMLMTPIRQRAESSSMQGWKQQNDWRQLFHSL